MKSCAGKPQMQIYTDALNPFFRLNYWRSFQLSPLYGRKMIKNHFISYSWTDLFFSAKPQPWFVKLVPLSGSGYLFSGSKPGSLFKDSPPSGVLPHSLFATALVHTPAKPDPKFDVFLSFWSRCFRLLLAQVRQPAVVPAAFACSLGGRFYGIQLRLWPTEAAPHQPRPPQHQRPEAPALLNRPGPPCRVPSRLPIPLLRGAHPLCLQWLLFLRHITLPKPEWCASRQFSPKEA